MSNSGPFLCLSSDLTKINMWNANLGSTTGLSIVILAQYHLFHKYLHSTTIQRWTRQMFSAALMCVQFSWRDRPVSIMIPEQCVVW